MWGVASDRDLEGRAGWGALEEEGADSPHGKAGILGELSICRVPQDRCLLLSDRAHRGGMCPVSLGLYWRECGCCLVWFHFPKSVLSGAELCPLKFIQSSPDPQGFKVLMVFEDRL